MSSLIQKIKLKCNDAKKSIVSTIATYRKPKQESRYSKEELQRMRAETKEFLKTLRNDIDSWVAVEIKKEKPFTPLAELTLKTEIKDYMTNLTNEAITLSYRGPSKEVVSENDIRWAMSNFHNGSSRNRKADFLKLIGGILFGNGIAGLIAIFLTLSLPVVLITIICFVSGTACIAAGYQR